MSTPDELRGERASIKIWAYIEKLHAKEQFLRWHRASDPPASEGYYLVIRHRNSHQTTRYFTGSQWRTRDLVAWWRELDYPPNA